MFFKEVHPMFLGGMFHFSPRTFDKDCDGKLKPEELLGILTWDESKLPEGLQEVIKEFQDSDGLISYEGNLCQ